VFKVGETVVHPKFGAGVVVELRKITYQERERSYFCIELVENRGTLMLPMEAVEEAGLRVPMPDMSLIEEVFDYAPETLNNDIHVRQAAIEAKLSSGSLVQVIQVLRDLSWRDQTIKLSYTDHKFKEQALSKLIEELMFNSTLKVSEIKSMIEQLVAAALHRHLTALQATV
jgi:RNA polymerase-interacting CarD/CdnL/TRCF family regulator